MEINSPSPLEVINSTRGRRDRLGYSYIAGGLAILAEAGMTVAELAHGNIPEAIGCVILGVATGAVTKGCGEAFSSVIQELRDMGVTDPYK